MARVCKFCGHCFAVHEPLDGYDVVECPGNRGWVTPDQFEEKAEAPAGGHAGFLAVLDELRALHLKKAADYGSGADPLANARAAAEFGVPAWVGVMIRAADKVHRIKAYIANGSLVNESLEDSLLDLASYAAMALALRREAK